MINEWTDVADDVCRRLLTAEMSNAQKNLAVSVAMSISQLTFEMRERAMCRGMRVDESLAASNTGLAIYIEVARILKERQEACKGMKR